VLAAPARAASALTSWLACGDPFFSAEGALLTDVALRHPTTAPAVAQLIDNASEHCKDVNKVILLQCWKRLRALIAARAYRDSALREEIVSGTRQATRSLHTAPSALAVFD